MVGLVGGLLALDGTRLAWYFVPARAVDAETARIAIAIVIVRFVNTVSPPLSVNG
jgi:hypothetical protein